MSGFNDFLKDVIPFAGPILGVLGSIFGGKGKKTEYAAQQTPQQQGAYNALLKMLQQRMGQPSAGYGPTSMAMNQLGNMFYGQNVVPPGGQQAQIGGGMSGGGMGGGIQGLLQMLQGGAQQVR